MECILPTKKFGDLTFYIDDEDEYLLAEYTFYAFKTNNQIYLQTKEGKYLHRLVMKDPKGLVIDHINHNTLDNRKCNLRAVSQSVNRTNSLKYMNDEQKLKAAEVKEILLSKESNKKTAQKYNVSDCLISNIRTGVSYKWYFPEIARRIVKPYIPKPPKIVYKKRKWIIMYIDEKQGLKIDKLTSKEQEVYLLILDGITNEEICRRLSISQTTFKTHLNNIYSKRQVHSKYELIIDFLKNQQCYKILQEIKEIATARITNNAV